MRILMMTKSLENMMTITTMIMMMEAEEETMACTLSKILPILTPMKMMERPSY